MPNDNSLDIINEYKMFIKFYCEEIEKKGINA